MSEPRVTQPHPLNERGHTHGRPSSWAVVTVILAAFAVGGAALILQMWILFFVCAGVFVLSVPAGMLIGMMNDTVEWITPPTGRRSEQLAEGGGGQSSPQLGASDESSR